MTGAQLKILALTAMTHTRSRVVLLPQVRLLRMVGRLAMPIYCFLLGEGLRHTRSLPRYLGRLLALALLSEWPFDLAFSSGVNWGYQNVFFTLVLGLTALALVRTGRRGAWIGAAGLAMLAHSLHTDYGWYGVVLTLLLGSRADRTITAAGMALLTLSAFGFSIQLWALAALPLLWSYHGEQGRRLGFLDLSVLSSPSAAARRAGNMTV